MKTLTTRYKNDNSTFYNKQLYTKLMISMASDETHKFAWIKVAENGTNIKPINIVP